MRFVIQFLIWLALLSSSCALLAFSWFAVSERWLQVAVDRSSNSISHQSQTLACESRKKSNGLVTGATNHLKPLSGWPERKEIRDLAKAGPAFDLYLLCQEDMMASQMEDARSFFQISGALQYQVDS